MTVGVDLRALQEGFKAHKARGIGVYTRALAHRMAGAPISLAGFHDPAYEAEEPLAHGSIPFRRSATARLLGPCLKEYIRQHVFLRRALTDHARRHDLSALFFPSHLDAPSGLPVPTVVTAHDMIQRALMERHYSTWKHRFHVKKQIDVLRQAKRIIAVSAHTKSDVVRYTGVPPEKVVVIYNGVDPAFRVIDDPDRSPVNGRPLPERFVLNVGGIDWRKNIELLFDSFRRLVDRHPDLSLVMTGAIEHDPRYAEFLGEMARRGLADRVVPVGFVSTDDLVRLYNLAEVFFYPSVYEGFGLPVAEAMACGTPVISTNRSSIPEVGGDAAILLDPDEPERFTQALCDVVSDAPLREDLAARGIERAKRFSWDIAASETWSCLASALS